jgi:hypothetical protein
VLPVPFTFDADKHPRDRRGRFTKSRTVRANAKDKKAVKDITDGFQPAKTGDGKAYAGKIADPGQQDAARDFALDAREINQDLRAGHADVVGVKPMDAAMRPLPEDVVLHRSVPAAAFGNVDPQSLQGMKVRDAGYSATQLDPPPPSDGVHMFIAAPKGSPAVVNGDTGEVYLDRDSEMVVSRVEKNAASGHDMYLTVLPKTEAKTGKAPVADNGGKADIEKPAVADKGNKTDTPVGQDAKPAKVEPKSADTSSSEPDKPAGGDEFRAKLMKQKVAELQAQMRERGLKPGKKRKSELVDALVVDETGHDGKPAETVDTAKTAAPATSRDSVEDRVRSALDTLIARDGGRPETLISLVRLRDELDDLPRSDLDEALLRLDRGRVVQLEPDPHRIALSDRAKAAAIPLGGEDMHLVTVLKPIKAKPADDHAGEPADFGSRLATAANGEDALLAAPLSLVRPDTYAKPGSKQGLTTHQRYALLDYQGSEYVKINGRLRALANGEKDTSTDDTAELTNDLDEAMAGSPLKSDAVVYRGIRASRKVFGDRIDADLTGMEWLETGFVSTTAVESESQHFSGVRTDPVRMRILAPKGTPAIQVSVVADSVGAPDEAELLLNRDTRMRVVADRGIVDGIRHLDVEVVP